MAKVAGKALVAIVATSILVLVIFRKPPEPVPVHPPLSASVAPQALNRIRSNAAMNPRVQEGFVQARHMFER